MLVSGKRDRSPDQLETRALQAAGGLRAAGVGPGDAVALLLRNDFAFFEASFAAQAVGAYAVPINWHLAPDEVAYILKDCAARVLIGHADLLNRAGPAIPDGMRVLTVPTPDELAAAYGLAEAACLVPTEAELWDEWLAGYSPLTDLCPQVPEAMTYTSGTTGLPKGVRRNLQARDQMAEVIRIRDRVYGIEPGIRSLIAGPLYHGAPNNFGLRSAKVAERTVLMPRFDAEALLAAIERHRITNIFMVPTMFVRLLRLPQAVRDAYDLSSLRHVVHAAAPCPSDVKQAMIDWWGPIIHEFYAGTEGSYWTLCDSAEWLARPGTVGRVIDGATLKALDEAGLELPPSVPGELYGRLHCLPDFTYHNLPEERAKVERDGLITLGDVGYFDDQGYLFLCDRKRDMVISGGVNIYPAEIEAALTQMPGVEDSAVFGIPDGEYGEKLLAVVAPHNGAVLDTESVVDFLKSRIAGYKVPRLVEVRTDLPRGDDGKIYKRRLRDAYWLGRERRI